MRLFTKAALVLLFFSFHTVASQVDSAANVDVDDKRPQTSSEHPVASSEFDLMDKNKDGVVTEKEASEIGVNSLFSDMDINGDGVLSLKEYMKYRDQETPQTRDDF
ncbi:hypothetical protein [Alteromonas sp. H39]|uniref:hypothetical protein n=1 Tax=Alteromonas sp. H39 TaxID=3389876 RepID=UPI0039DF740F